VLPGLAIDAAGGKAVADRVDEAAIAGALRGADLVIVDNLCSLPLNIDAAHAVARVAAAHKGRVLFRHHDLPWQRRHLAEIGADLPPRVAGALHATINLRSRRELEARGYAGATTIHNFFDLDPAPGDRDTTRAQFGFDADAFVMLQPSRAIERKNVPGAVRVASHLARIMANRSVHLWISGPAEDGYADTLARIIDHSPVPVTLGRATSVADAYAASDLVVFPSTWEGFGNPVIEAIAARRACAAFPYPVLSEILAAGVRCFSTEQPEVLVRFLAEPEARRETYFDVNLRRAHVSFSLDQLPGTIEHAFSEHGWVSW
jgi:glycosyltransferase involved in cell wall biosynthesis